MIKAPINKIIPHSVVDGLGNRTSVFFQGCNFSCKYCHNPETINLCINCGLCVGECPVKALNITDGKVAWDKGLCIDCEACIKVCPSLSSPKITYYTPIELSKIVAKNIPFIRGVTCSGGECTLYSDFITEFFTHTREIGLNNLLDSNGGIFLGDYPKLLEVTDGVMLDIKAITNKTHLELTGKPVDSVIENMLHLAKINKLVELRTVCIEGEDNENIIRTVLDLLKGKDILQTLTYKIISYRHMGVRDEFLYLSAPSAEEMARLRDIVISYGVNNAVLI